MLRSWCYGFPLLVFVPLLALAIKCVAGNVSQNTHPCMPPAEYELRPIYSMTIVPENETELVDSEASESRRARKHTDRSSRIGATARSVRQEDEGTAFDNIRYNMNGSIPKAPESLPPFLFPIACRGSAARLALEMVDRDGSTRKLGCVGPRQIPNDDDLCQQMLLAALDFIHGSGMRAMDISQVGKSAGLVDLALTLDHGRAFGKATSMPLKDRLLDSEFMRHIRAHVGERRWVYDRPHGVAGLLRAVQRRLLTVARVCEYGQTSHGFDTGASRDIGSCLPPEMSTEVLVPAASSDLRQLLQKADPEPTCHGADRAAMASCVKVELVRQTPATIAHGSLAHYALVAWGGVLESDRETSACLFRVPLGRFALPADVAASETLEGDACDLAAGGDGRVDMGSSAWGVFAGRTGSTVLGAWFCLLGLVGLLLSYILHRDAERHQYITIPSIPTM